MNLRRPLDSVGIGPFAANAESTADRGILNAESVSPHDLARTAENGAIPQAFPAHVAGHGRSASYGSDTANLGKILAALSLSTRETDVAGWYKNNSVIGVMFTEIGLDDRGSIVSTMIARLSETLRNDLSFEQFNQISVSFHVYPEEWNHEVPKGPEQSGALSRPVQTSTMPGGFPAL